MYGRVEVRIESVQLPESTMAQITFKGANIVIPSAVRCGVRDQARRLERPSSSDTPRDGDSRDNAEIVDGISDLVAMNPTRSRAEARFDVVRDGGRLLEALTTERTVKVALSVYP